MAEKRTAPAAESNDGANKRPKGNQPPTFVCPSRLRDPNSHANNYDARVTHFHLDLTANFATSVLSGHVDIDTEVLVEGNDKIVLDTKTLVVVGVECEGKALEYKMDEAHESFGQALNITLPHSKKGATAKVRVRYSTTPDCSAVQWLPASQTAGKQHPYLFTQCQAIHARAMFPCQDTPSNKCPYSATIHTPAPLVALMSAVSTKHEEEKGTIHYHFNQPVPMPCYLVALAIGALEKRDIGPRSAVWSEKETVDAGAYEFAETEKFIQIAEKICGPYQWGRYDILLLPPSFPYGGMENPCLTFVTPTLLAGDRSLANVVAHEISHSWMGNLVTSHTWEHFWMNEGFTVFLERKILKAMHGGDQRVADMSAAIGWKALQDSVEQMGGADHPYTILNVKLDGVDPDDAFSSVPYEKGFNFLLYLEGLVGGSEVMDPFLRAHCDKFAFSCVNAQQWKAFFLDYFKHKQEALKAVDWNKWLHSPGMPPKPTLDTSLMDDAVALATRLCGEHGVNPITADISGWHTAQKLIFLQEIQALQTTCYAKDDAEEKSLFEASLRAIDKHFAFSDSRNSEIRFRWFTACIRADMQSAFGGAVAFLLEQGRMKFIRPLYRDLYKSKGKQLAVDTFKANHTQYHSIAQKMVAKDLDVTL